MEIISHYKSAPFTLINLELPVNFDSFACTKNHNFEEGENCASTVSVEQSFGSDMNIFGSDLFSDLIICDSGFKIQELLVLLITGFINFGVTNQAPQISFKLDVEDSMLVFSYEFADIIFCELLVILNKYKIMDLNNSLSTVPGFLYLWSHAHPLTELVKRTTFCIRANTCS